MHPHTPVRRRSQGGARRRGAFAVVGVTLAAVAGMMVPTAAQAAADTPFDPNVPTVFVGYNAPTTLATANLVAGSGYSLTTLRPAAGQSYNALGFNTVDNFLYGWDNGNSTVLRLDSVGELDSVGSPFGSPMTFNQGTFGLGADAGTYYVRNDADSTIYAIDVVTLTSTQITLTSPVPNVSDIVYRDGYIWAYDGQTASTRYFYRIDPATGAVSSWDISSLGLVAQPYGGQWLYGNGDYGMTGNTDGTVYKISIQNGETATPTFSVVSTERGVPTGNNDAASVLGAPADLAVTKSGDPLFFPGMEYTYTITVANNGPGASSGSQVTDVLPSGLLNPTTSTDGCTITAGAMNCTVGVLPVGATATATVSGVVAADATADTLTNSATVRGNEADPNAANDTATFTPALIAPELTLVKTADTAQATAAGQVIGYTFTVTNTGDVPVQEIAIDEGSFSGSGELGDIVCPAQTEPLAPEGQIVCAADYSVVAGDLTGEALVNTATARGIGPDAEVVVSADSTATVETVVPAVTPPAPTAPRPTGQLAATGGDDLTWAAYAAGLLVLMGTALVTLRRRTV